MMFRTVAILTVSLVGAAAVTWLYAANRPHEQPLAVTPPATTAVPQVSVLVARHALTEGAIVQTQDLDISNQAAAGLPPDYIAANSPVRAKLPGQMVVHGVAAGAPIVLADVQPPTTETAALLAPGMRAIAIAVNPQTSVAGLLTRGDFVDVLLSYKMDNGADASRTILQNIRVVATDQNTNETGKPGTAVPKTVTLEVTPDGAKMIALAVQVGTLSLSLSAAPRGGAGNEIVLDDRPITTRDLTSAGQSDPAPVVAAVTAAAPAPVIAAPDVQIFRGSGVSRAADGAGGSSNFGAKAGH
ncbi:MAG: Flp pilus assembly protein CpaB [Rhodobacteraceae bacterium]|nr:Flp pilus assembly protein CpaB [Paracoccaceae bacterium]